MTTPSIAAFSDSHKANIKWEMKIDKLTLLHELPNSWKEGMVSALIALITDTSSQSTYGISRSYSPGCRGYEISIEGRVPLSTKPLIWSKQAGYLLQCGPKKGKTAWLRLDINPGCLTAAGLTHLQKMLDSPFDIPWPTWSIARVSRIDLAVDLYGIELTDWVWDLPKRSARELFCRGRELRTIYLGAKKGSPLVIYNKAKQNPIAAAGGALTRVEYRLKNPGFVQDLPNLSNPMKDLIVLNPAKLNYPDPHKMALMSVGHLQGRHGILQTFPTLCRSTVDLALMKTRAAWWDAAEIWEAWGQCLQDALPTPSDASGKTHPIVVAYQQSMQAIADGAGVAPK